MSESNLSNSSTRPIVVTSVTELRHTLAAVRRSGRRIGAVPTMGALHDGHLSLVRAARQDCDFIVVTIFVNPTQFGPKEDLAKYPRTLDADLDLLTREKTDLVFVPDNADVYPEGFSTFIEPPDVAKPLEGEFRPGHFRGVATVVMKLFQMVTPDIAYFGQKDYQQCLVIQHMVKDLNVPIVIRICPIVREHDGLAMSSRNRYLTDDERARALAISRSLDLASEKIAGGERRANEVVRTMTQVLSEAGIERVDYVAIRQPETLASIDQIAGPVVLLIAAFVGSTRLIDNRLIG